MSMTAPLIPQSRIERDPYYFHELALTPDELQVVFEAMRAGGFATIDGFLRVAAAKLAMHLNVRVPPDAFQLTRKFR